MEIFQEIIENTIKSFTSLWQVHKRGNSIEIVTPTTTINNYFVSVFLTIRGNRIIVTDGGFVDNGDYENEESDSSLYKRLIDFYIQSYEVLTVTGRGNTYYYKETTNKEEIPSLILDLSMFISSIVNNSLFQFERQKEQAQFKTKAVRYLHLYISKNYFVSANEFSKELSGVRFGSIININNQYSFINYVSGTNGLQFIDSLCRSKASFELLNMTKYSVKSKKLTLLDDDSYGMKSDRIYPYMNLAKQNKKVTFINWSAKERVKDLILYNKEQ